MSFVFGAQTNQPTATGPGISGRDWLEDWRETWTEAAICTLSVPADEPDGGYAGRLRTALNAYTRLSERLSKGFDWLREHDETHPSWAKNQALYDRLWWQRELVWQRAVADSNNLAIAVWRLWVDYSHMTPEQQQQATEFDDIEESRAESPQDIWNYLTGWGEIPYRGEWPPNPSEGWWNEKPRAGKD